MRGHDMEKNMVFPISILMSFAAFGLIVILYIQPVLKPLSGFIALQSLVALHAYRFVGLAFLIPGVVAERLPPAFSRPAAYGDLITAVLAVIAALMLHDHLKGALLVTWLFNIWGTADLLNALFQGVWRISADSQGPGLLGAAFFIPTVFVPALLITHGLIFWLLLSGNLGT